MIKLRLTILWLVALFVLGFVNYGILDKETLIASGDTVLLELAPVDPRSLIQGDYMRLQYKITEDWSLETLPGRGTLVATKDNNQVASFVRFYAKGKPLAEEEFLLNYHKEGSWARVGAGSFFFQEGEAETYQVARYAEIRVEASGTTVLVGLRDEAFNLLGEAD